MEVEDVTVSYCDVMRMAGKIVISCESQSFKQHLDDRPVSGWLEDCWKQTQEILCSVTDLPGVRYTHFMVCGIDFSFLTLFHYNNTV